ncbi:hypothetical protein RRG08_049945 [Elysia crispata]|uniref:Uncharacterized protein n=1 Tax=Elysia crispata TaxID=231223 RepID=A0AAE1ACU4_9GAST|nr:hypothetical protein RRG08_049945 [Elysia crispata]
MSICNVVAYMETLYGKNIYNAVIEDRVREPNHKLQVEENLRVCNLITTGTTILTGRSTNVTTSPAADDGG